MGSSMGSPSPHRTTPFIFHSVYKLHTHPTARWDKMGSSMLNEKPDEPEDHGHGYVPQYDVTGQGLRYRMSLEGESSVLGPAGSCGVDLQHSVRARGGSAWLRGWRRPSRGAVDGGLAPWHAHSV